MQIISDREKEKKAAGGKLKISTSLIKDALKRMLCVNNKKKFLFPMGKKDFLSIEM